MKQKGFKSFLMMAVSLAMIFSLLTPNLVLAEDTTSEPTSAAEQQTAAQETEVPGEGEDTAAEQDQTQEPLATEGLEETEIPLVDSSLPESTEESPVEPTQEFTAEPEIQPENITEIVVAAAEADVVLADDSGEPVVLASLEAEELLNEIPDPWVIRAGVTHRFLSSCAGQPVDATNTCTVSTTPVQAAIDFANAGETVYLGPGTFEEDIEILKSINLQGTTGTIIRSPELLNVEFTSSADQKPIIYVNDATVVIDNITVDGFGRGNANNRFSGIAFYNAGGTVSNITITGVRDSTLSGTQHGVGIYAYNEDGVARTLNIFNNTIVDFQKNAMALSGEDLTVNVSGNTVTGAGPTDITAQNGIQVSFGATGSVTNNTVSGISYTGPKWSATGILIYDAEGTVLVDGNNVLNNQTGINANTPINALNNSLSNNDYGIYVGPGGGDSQIRYNSFLNNYYGYNGDNPTVYVRDNIFIGNTYGVYGDYEEGIGYGLYNYWGCDAGPDGTTCDSAYGVSYDPWLMDPDGDRVFVSSDGTGGYVDNCPLVYNPNQADSDGDGIGDACETGGGDPVIVTPVAPVLPVGGIGGLIPVTGGEMQKLVCPAGSDEVILRLENGDLVRFIGLCDLDAVLSRVGEDALPGALPASMTYVSDMLVQVLEEGVLLELFTSGSIELSFVIPQDFKDADLGLMVWDDETESWVEIPLHTPALEYPLPLTEEPTEQRVILNGLSPEAQRALSRENFSGLFLLVAK